MQEANAKINKYPYFLWLNHSVSVSFDKDLIFIENELGEKTKSKKTRVSKVQVFFMKHLPVLIFGIYSFIIPSLQSLVLGLIVFAIAATIIIYIPKWFKIYILLICICGFQMVFYDLELLVEHSFNIVCELTLWFFLIREIHALVQDDEYYCIQEVNINQKLDKKVLQLLYLSFGGFYLRVKKQEIRNEE